MKRVQMRRGVKLAPNTKYVGRPTRWGNPFVIGVHVPTRDGIFYPVGRAGVVALYREWARRQIVLDPLWLEPLRGYDLACYCDVDLPCHVDALLSELVRAAVGDYFCANCDHGRGAHVFAGTGCDRGDCGCKGFQPPATSKPEAGE